MLNDFIFHNPTKIYFGRTALSHLKEALAEFGPRVLLVYGKGAIKRIGLYSAVMKELAAAGKQVTELAGVSPNPRYSEVLSGAALVRENEIDLILAVGGGSVIDCAKAISVSAYCEGDAWQKYWVDFRPLENRVVAVASIRFLRDYIEDARLLSKVDMNPLELNLQLWECLAYYSFRNADVYENLFFGGSDNGLYAEAVQLIVYHHLIIVEYECRQIGEADNGKKVGRKDSRHLACNKPPYHNAHSYKRAQQRQSCNSYRHTTMWHHIHPVENIKIGYRDKEK